MRLVVHSYIITGLHFTVLVCVLSLNKNIKTVPFSAIVANCRQILIAHDKMSTCSSHSSNAVNCTALQTHSSVTCTYTPVTTAAVLTEAEVHNLHS